MVSRSDHREAVVRRLELLRAELDPDRAPGREPEPGTQPWWETAPVYDLAPRPEPGDAPAVPVPGRHASRRRAAAGAGWSALLPETLRGRVRLGPWQLTVVALVVAAGLGVTCWWVVRGDASVTVPVAGGTAAPLVPASPAAAGPAPAAAGHAPTAAGGSTAPGGTVTVDVSGKVRRPGVLELPAGSRVVDALSAAGGPRPGADLSALNRARLLVDGEQIVVGRPPPAAATGGTLTGPAGGPASAAGGGPTGPAGLVNLNTASLEELDSLPEVGPVTAQSILDYRAEHGGFAAVDELLDIDGIGEKTLAKIAPHVTV